MTAKHERAEVIVVGAGPQAKVAIDIIRESGRKIAGVVDDDPNKRQSRVLGVAVIGNVHWALGAVDEDVEFFVAIGANTARRHVGDRLREAGRKLTNLIHPSAVVSSTALIGTGVLICAGAILGVETTVEHDAVINTGTHVDHESSVGAGAYLAPGVLTAGRITVGQDVFIGVGSTLGPGITISDGAIIGAGSLVLGNVPAGMVAWGRPAAIVRPVPQPIDWGRLLTGRGSA